MLLHQEHSLTVNHKAVRRSMKVQGLKCAIRRKKPHYGNAYASQASKAFPNLLRQQFKTKVPRSVYSGDVTEVRLHTSMRVYIHMVKDLATKEIVSFNVSASPDTSLVLREFRLHLLGLESEILKKLIYHTDQGGVFMSDPHKDLMKKLGVTQSMSRRGNCLDNAPIESFFGHMKDFVDFKRLSSLTEVAEAVRDYVDYYNNGRPQWGLKKMTPAKYRSHLGN